jgi:hypothetical protein
MNVQRGLFRLWIAITALWAAATAFVAFYAIPDGIKGQSYQYVYVMRSDGKPWDQDWKKPLYEIMRSPSKENLPVSFSELEWRYREEWDKDVQAGRTHKVDFPDGTVLYLNSSLTAEDRNFVAKAFWDQRWKRWVSQIWPWFFGLVLPPTFLLIMGQVLLWVGRGFKTT